jgi:hypothetical protein
MVKRPDSNEVVLDNLALTAPTQPVRSPMYAPNTHFPHTRCRTTEFHVIYKACTPGLAFVLRASLPNCYYPHARRWPRQQPRQHGWENASYCTSTVISTVALRLGTLYSTAVPTERARQAREILDRRPSSLQVRHGTGGEQ